jgi:hypothetical protein
VADDFLTVAKIAEKLKLNPDDPELDLIRSSGLDPLCGLPGYADRTRWDVLRRVALCSEFG